MFRYVELLSGARTPLADFFSILLKDPARRDYFPSLPINFSFGMNKWGS